MVSKEKLPCVYGSKCYRKNPKHFENYSHPNDLMKGETKTQFTVKGNVAKKRRLEDNDHCVAENSDEINICKNDEKCTSNEPNQCFENVHTDKIVEDLKCKSAKEIIKELFLVDMPDCFYSFYEFCKSINNDKPENALNDSGLKLVGPFDVLLGKMNLSINEDLALCHWRFYYDPPEFQTVLTSSSRFHIGYWRDDPNNPPVFLASNNCGKSCTFKMEAENIFGAVFQHLGNCMKSSDPFKKVKLAKLQTSLSEWAKKYEFTLEKTTCKTTIRQKKVVSKTFHKLGIVVPVEKKTKVGYRPLIETDSNLKKICKCIMNADDEKEQERLWDNLLPLVNAANIANDECDFGNSLELGIDLFCMGSPVFHRCIEHLLTIAYSLLNRTVFEKIIRAHLKRRKTGQNLSVN